MYANNDSLPWWLIKLKRISLHKCVNGHIKSTRISTSLDNINSFFLSVTKSKIRIKIFFKVLLARRRNWRVAFPSFTTTEREKSFSLQSFHPRLGLWNGEITNRSCCCCFWKQTLTSSFFEIFSTYMYRCCCMMGWGWGRSSTSL